MQLISRAMRMFCLKSLARFRADGKHAACRKASTRGTLTGARPTFLQVKRLTSSRVQSLNSVRNQQLAVIKNEVCFYVVCFSRYHGNRPLIAGDSSPAQEIPKSQPPLWSSKPDVACVREDGEWNRLGCRAARDRSNRGVKDAKTIEKCPWAYDEAIRQINAANIFQLMRPVHSGCCVFAIMPPP